MSDSQTTETAESSHPLTRWLSRANDAQFAGYAIVAAFMTYFCMYAFRKPFTAAEFAGSKWDLATAEFFFGKLDLTTSELAGQVDLGFLPPMDFKILLIISQVLGYTLSKFIGIKVISEMSGKRRGMAIITLIVIAELALLGFALTPRPYSAFWLFVNGLPLGMIWGLTYGYLEGRRLAEILGAGLSASYIVASGFVKTVGRWVMDAGAPEEWMPVLTGLIFFGPMLLFVWLLSKLPKPNAEDEALRTRRAPMDGPTRMRFLRAYGPGLFFLTALYTLLTAYRSFRDDFGFEIWKDLGYEKSPEIMTTAELPIAFGVLIALALLYRIKGNRKALLAVHWLMAGGTALVGISTLAFQAEIIGPVTWMVTIGLGLYFAYVPFGCVLFDRLIAAVGFVATAGFMIYVTDAFGYLGSVALMLVKNFGAPKLEWLDFFMTISLITSVVCTACFIISGIYFARRTKDAPNA